MPRLLTIMGSGETSPTMVKTHRSILDRFESPHAVVLDTPYGFQENASELAQRAVMYFATSVGYAIEIAGLQSLTSMEPLALAQGFDRVRRADYLFAGPGSPTYALREWADAPIAALLIEKLTHGGAVTFASAAALTLGCVTVPVYEIYKAGEAPAWRAGLDVLAAIGIRAAVIPHFDNREGGTHDTRFCYLGERRLVQLERTLPDDAIVLGVDEHTGLAIDLDAGSATVVGVGSVTLRRLGASSVWPTGSQLDIEFLQSGRLDGPRPPRTVTMATGLGAPESVTTSLRDDLDRCQAAFDAALSAQDAGGAAVAALDLEACLHGWSSDTLQSDEADRARLALRAMIVRLADAARDGLRDPNERVAPFAAALMAIRDRVRAERRFDLADLIREKATSAGIEIRDTAHGSEWNLL